MSNWAVSQRDLTPPRHTYTAKEYVTVPFAGILVENKQKKVRNQS